jgi:hypothetical protein
VYGVPGGTYPVCKGCYYRRTRVAGADRRYRLWADAYARAKATGAVFSLRFSDVPVSTVCPVTGDVLVHLFPSALHPATPAHAVLDVIDPGKGFVAGNVRCVSREAAGLDNIPAAPVKN